MFALKEKGTFRFSCVARTEEEFGRKISTAFSAWRGIQPQGSNKPISEFLEKYDKVVVEVKPYECEEN